MKPIVYYIPRDIDYLRVGSRAFVHCLDHYNPDVLGNGIVCTSKVIRVGTHGEFETLNTVYKAHRLDQED